MEASLDIAAPQPEEVLRNAPARDPIARLELIDAALHDMVLAHEGSLRMMLAYSVQRSLTGGGDSRVPARQNRRTPLIEAALEPARQEFKSSDLKNLVRALGLVIGTESHIVFKDVLNLDDAEARKVKRWAIRALVQAARKPG